MTAPAPQYPGAPGELGRYIPVRNAEANLSPDIAELIMADHRRIRRLCGAVYDAARPGDQPDPDWMLGHVWQRLADLLVAHTQAEEETCYASVPGAGRRAALRAADRMRDPIADHEENQEDHRRSLPAPRRLAAMVARGQHRHRGQHRAS